MEKIIKEIYEEVKNRCMLESNAYGIGAWTHHIELVYNIAVQNCNKYGADSDSMAHFYSILHYLEWYMLNRKCL